LPLCFPEQDSRNTPEQDPITGLRPRFLLGLRRKQ